MKNLKKVLALVIAFTMMLGFGVSASVFPDVADDASYAEAVTILSAMGIMVGDDNGNFRPDDTITRAEAAAIVVRAKGLGDAAEGAKGATSFSDVAADHWATGYINLAAQSGIINGFTDGTFRPEEPVAYEQMVKMIVAALGFEPKAKLNGGYPTGYLVIAAQEKINSGATGSAGEPAKRSVDARLIFNALTVKMMEVSEYGTDITYAQGNKTLLKDYLDTHVIEGVVATTPLTNGTTVDDDEVTFNVARYDDVSVDRDYCAAMTIYEDKVAVSELIGEYVTAYISEDDDGDWAIIAIAPKTGKNQRVALDYSQLESFDGEVVEYTPEGSSRVEEIELARSPKYFYNGRTGSDDNKVNDFLRQGTVIPGTVEFLDNNNDDIYDYVFVTAYIANYVVKEVGTNKLIDKDDNTIPKIDMRDEDRIVRFYKDGAVIEFSDIAAGDVVTLAYGSSDKLINVYVNNASVTGTVTEISNDEDKYYTIDGKQYRLASDGPSVAMGDEGVFYLNVDNRIVYKEATATEIGNYAYMYTANIASGLGGATAEVKFINAKGEWITADVYKYAKVYRLNSGTYAGKKPIVAGEDATAATNGVDMGIYTVADGKATPVCGVFKYTTNSDGEINNIYLAGAKDSDNLSIDAYATAPGKAFNASDLRIGSTYFTKDTVVFSVPEDGNLTDEDDISVTTVGSMFQDDTEYVFDAYDITDGFPNLVVVKGEETKVDDATRVLVVDSITETRNADDEEVKKIAGYQSGQAVSGLTSTEIEFFKADGSAYTGFSEDDLKAGDVIIFSLNSKGEIDKVKVLLTYAEAKEMIAASKTGSEGSYIFETDSSTNNFEVTTMFGFAAKKESGNKLNITKKYVNNANLIAENLIDENEGKPIMYRSAAPANFYEINTERSKVSTSVISYSDLEVELSNSTDAYKYDGSWVYVRMIDNAVTDVVVYTAYNPAE